MNAVIFPTFCVSVPCFFDCSSTLNVVVPHEDLILDSGGHVEVSEGAVEEVGQDWLQTKRINKTNLRSLISML